MYSHPIRTLTLAALSAVVLTAACRAVTSVQPTPSPERPVATAEAVEMVPAAGVLEACDKAAQAGAMKPEPAQGLDANPPGACYDLALNLDPDDSSFTGTARITLTNQTGGALSDLVLRTYPNAEEIYGGSLTVDSSSVNGEIAAGEVFLEDRTAYRIPLSEPLPPDATALIELAFHGQVPENLDELPSAYGIFSHDTEKQFISIANWYPMLAQWKDGEWLAAEVSGPGDAVVSESALYRVEVDAPADWEIVTTGSETNRSADSGSGRTFASGPARDFIVLASPNLTESVSTVEGTTIRHWGLLGGEGRWEETLQATADAFQVYTDSFGDYPYTELDVIAAPMRNALGVEYPGVFLIDEGLYEADQQRPFLLGLVVAHEAAHQWWYGVIGNDVLADPWQDEGLTTFSSSLYQEIHQPLYYLGTMQSYKESVDDLDGQQSVEELAIAQPVSAFQGRENLYGRLVYQKSALFFQALRERLGEETFLDALRKYYSENRFQLAPPEALLAAFEQSCQCDLDDIYREWGAISNQ